MDIISSMAIGFVLCLMVAAILTFDNHDTLRECEKALPRDQHCKLIAVPEEPHVER